MPHANLSAARAREPFSPPEREPWKIGAILVLAFSASVLGAGTLLARGTPSGAGGGETVLAALRGALGREAGTYGVVSETQARVPAGAAVRTFVAGRILGAQGNPVAEVEVRVMSEARPGCHWVTSSRSDGSFQVDGVPAGKVLVAARDTEAGLVESAALDIEDAYDVVLVLDRTVELSGTVLDERGAAIGRAVVKLARQAGTPDRIVVTDDDGRFTLRTPARAGDRITVWARGYEATAVTLGPFASDVIKQNVRLHAGAPVRGTVVEPSGAPVAGVRVSACPGKEAEVTTSDAAGAFELPATAIGCWVSAYHPRFAGSRLTRIADGRAMVVRLGVGGAIEGSAVDEHGKLVALFSVTIASFEPEDDVAGNATRAGETAAHLRGKFRVDDLAPGRYVLRLSAEGRVDTDSRAIEVVRGHVIRGEQVILPAADPATGGEGIGSTDAAEPEGDSESREVSAPSGDDAPTESAPVPPEEPVHAD